MRKGGWGQSATGETAGILQLINKHSGPFAVEDEEFLNALSVHMSLALENAMLHREMIEKKRLERELQLARGIQRSLRPDAPPVVRASTSPCPTSPASRSAATTTIF